jgi:hypothetical protein
MSKHWGYVCQSHNPQIESERLINWGQDTLADAYRRERAGEWPNNAAFAEEWPALDPVPLPVTHNGFEYQGVIPWLREHPHCVIALRSEYGETVPLDPTPPPLAGGNHMATNFPFTLQQMHPIAALRYLVAFDSRDWADNRADAWLYGIVIGWDPAIDEADEESSMPDVAARHGWDAETVARLRILHKRFKATLPPGA